jgi:ubiquitin-protein ligase
MVIKANKCRFDLLLGDDYPMSPPKIRFVLENVDSDGHHINPNLHVGGQVCLSILNTWAGTSDEMWQPNKSTILAVLVSIQAMILGACHPWENEPGEEYRADTPASAQYNLMVQSKTVKYGMIPFLQEKTKGPSAFISASHIWKDVAAAYWKYNGDKILATVQEWAQTNERIQNYHASDNLVSRRAPKGKQKARAGEDLLFTLTSLISLDTATEKSKREASSLTTPPKRQKTDAFIEPRSASGYRSSSSSKPTEYASHPPHY